MGVPGSGTETGKGRWFFSRKPSRASIRYSLRRGPSRLARSGFCSWSFASQAVRSSSGSASAWSRYGLTDTQCLLMADIAFLTRYIRAQAAVEVNARLVPMALHRPFGNATHAGDFRE